MYHVKTNFEIDYPISIEEFKEINIGILATFVDFCETHGLKYFLAGGTLIGAARHQGFIPWDDDIDVSMPRPDFERLRELTLQSGKIGNNTIRSIDLTPDLHCRPFMRLVDDGYIAQINTDESFISPWIDIHALDGLPTDPGENKKHWDKARRCKWFSRLVRTPFSWEKRRLRGIIKRILFFPFFCIGPVHYARKLIKLRKKYDFYRSEFVASYCAGYGRKERMPAYYFTDGTAKLYFEGIFCSVPPHFNKVLQKIYGNYLMLPPVEKRKWHVVQAWKLKK